MQRAAARGRIIDRSTSAENGALSGQDLFRVSIDGSNFVDVSSTSISNGVETQAFNGSGLANAISLALNDQFGDEKFFDFSSTFRSSLSDYHD